jgi:hypothetical protein
MSHPLFFLCPNCSGEESISGSTCVLCNSSIKIDKDVIAWDNHQVDIARYYQLLLEKLALSACKQRGVLAAGESSLLF